MTPAEYNESKIAELDRDIADWTKSIEMIESNNELRVALAPQVEMLRQKIADWQGMKKLLVALRPHY